MILSQKYKRFLNPNGGTMPKETANQEVMQENPAEKKEVINKPESKGQITDGYVSELRDENKKRRHENEELSKKMQETENSAKAALEEVKALQEKANKKILRAELKVSAAKYGLRDLDDIQLADLSSIKIDDNGDVLGVDEALSALKEKKGYLFEEVSTSNSRVFHQPNPASSSGNQTDIVSKMTDEQYAEHERKWLSSL